MHSVGLTWSGINMDFWHFAKVVIGGLCVFFGLTEKEFKPLGWTTELIWGKGERAKIPRWVAGPFYVILGTLMIYWGLTGK